METVFAFFASQPLVLTIVVSLLLGLFIGLRREIDIQQEGSEGFVGFRTMPLIVMLGALSVSIPQIPFLPVIALVGVIGFLSIAYYNGVFKLNLIGLTSEFATLLMFLAGMLVGYGQFIEAIILTVIIALLTGFKSQLHSFASGISIKEWSGALQLLILSAIVLPFLPREAVDPLGVLVPFDIWLLVIFISGIGFVGYFLNKYLAAKHGLLLTSFLGSLVSSTAVTTALAIQAKSQKEMPKQLFVLALTVASATMLLRSIVTILALAPAELKKVAIVPSVMFLFTALIIFFLSRKKVESEIDVDPELHSPFELLPALKFGAIFVVVLLAVALGKRLLGDNGVLITAFLSGFVDVDATTLSSIQAARIGEIATAIAIAAITTGIVINTGVKALYVWILSRRDVAVMNLGMIASVVGVGVVTFLFI